MEHSFRIILVLFFYSCTAQTPLPEAGEDSDIQVRPAVGVLFQKLKPNIDLAESYYDLLFTINLPENEVENQQEIKMDCSPTLSRQKREQHEFNSSLEQDRENKNRPSIRTGRVALPSGPDSRHQKTPQQTTRGSQHDRCTNRRSVAVPSMSTNKPLSSKHGSQKEKHNGLYTGRY